MRRTVYQNTCIAKLKTRWTVLPFLRSNTCGWLDQKPKRRISPTSLSGHFPLRAGNSDRYTEKGLVTGLWTRVRDQKFQRTDVQIETTVISVQFASFPKAYIIPACSCLRCQLRSIGQDCNFSPIHKETTHKTEIWRHQLHSWRHNNVARNNSSAGKIKCC